MVQTIDVYWNATAYYDIIRFPVNELSDLLRTYFEDLKDYLVSTVEHLILALVLYGALCVLLYLCITRWRLISFDRDMRNAKRILFVTAHPDDEVMFFGPTILHYIENEKCNVYLLCLSTGKNYGMNKIRTKELYKSCKVLGIKQENIFIYNNTNLPDTMDVKWPLEVISKHIDYYVQAYSITNLVTFDRYGVSGHTNHCSIYYAVANLILEGRLAKNCGVFVLESVNVVRKYWLLLDLPLSLIFSRFRYMRNFSKRKTIWKAMGKHKSQLVWFRRLYMMLSRYMLINTLQQINLVDIELDLELED